MTTWHIDLNRDGAGQLITTAPENPPDWVDALLSDLTYRMHESPDARQITVKVTGPDPQETPHATAGPVTSSGPGTPPPDAVIPPVSEQLQQQPDT